MNEAEMISLQSHTIGSIGQIIKICEDLESDLDKEEAYDKICDIYEGYIKRIKELIK